MFDGEFGQLFERTRKCSEWIGSNELPGETWRTDPSFVLDPEDDFEISSDDLFPESHVWTLQPGDEVVYKDENTGRTFSGTVLGFDAGAQKGRIMYVETEPGKMIYIDGILYGGGIVSATRDGTLLPGEEENPDES